MRGRPTAALAGCLALLVTVACSSAVTTSAADLARVAAAPGTSADRDTATTWLDAGPGSAAPDVASSSLISGRVELYETTDELLIELDHARVVRIPGSCQASTVTHRQSAIVGSDLLCVVKPGVDHVAFTAIVLGESGDEVSGQVTATRGLEQRTGEVPPRTISGGEPEVVPDVRLVSSPDFLNGDVGDLADGPGLWAQQDPATRTANSTNDAYEHALDVILDDWQGLDPAGVLVAGDLTDGRWGYDDQDSGNFGPVGTTAEQRLALQRAARTYYPQWKQRFADHDLLAFPAMGDHEYGDNPWPRRKRDLAADFKAEYARVFTTTETGRPLFADHPRGKARLTAYAGRPSPDLQVITLDVFDITPERAKVKVDKKQLKWLRQVLKRAQRDDVEWVVVQAHTPIIYPVRARDSSRLHYPRGRDSKLWKVFKKFGVDLYLAGEVHDTTATQADGIVQISHGGIFQFSLTTALVLDVHDERLYLTLRDYDMQHSEDPDGRRLWETRRNGMPFQLEISEEVSTIGTATVLGRKRGGARLSGASGILSPVRVTD